MAITADVLRIRDVFSSAADIRVPPYQRGFAWTDRETGALMRDLIEAFELTAIYFLGAMVFIQPKARGASDVVDGQQRLTTLTILLAVLRDLTTSQDEAASLHSLIGHETLRWVDWQRWRMTLNDQDTPFFREHIQTRGALRNIDQMMQAAKDSGSESQMRLAAAARLIYDELSDLGDEERSRFVKWLTEEVSFVKVRVTEHGIGYKVFLVLNQRGKPLSDHDILKSALFERAGFQTKEAIEHSRRWNSFANQLGAEDFEGMLKQIRFLYDRQMRGEFIDGFMHSIIMRTPVATFINDLLPRFVDAYDAVVKGKVERIDPGPSALRSLKLLKVIHHESWRAPAIHFLVHYPNDKETTGKFFAALERLAYMLQYAVKDREYRHRRYRRVLDAMDAGVDLFAENSPLNLSRDDQTLFLERLRGRFPNFKQRRALLMRICAAVPGGEPLDADGDSTVEHILPRTPPKGSEWYEEWSKARDIDELTECIGNFSLLTHAENQEADRKSFTEKMEIYFRNERPSFPMTEDLRGKSRWTPDDVRERRDRLIGHLARDWNL